ncbi:MAG: nucleotidyltransferase [Elusimicrobia bacterium]|nr:nucleotidyltransferase [Elusimicrobiota bacterium]
MSETENPPNLFLETLNWVVKKLDAINISYMITGGSAVGFWGHARTTMDIDMVVALKASQVDELFSEFEKDAYVSKDDILSAVSRKKMFNVIFNDTSFKIDFIPHRENDDYEKECFSRKVEINFGNLKLSVISPEDLIISKLKWMKIAGGSERQMSDCKSIILVNDNLDTAYIKKWARFLNIEEELKKCMTPFY